MNDAEVFLEGDELTVALHRDLPLLRGYVHRRSGRTFGAGAPGVQVAYSRRQQRDPVVAVAAQILLQHHVNHQRGVGLADAAGSQRRAAKLPQVVQRDGDHRPTLRRRTRCRGRP